MIQINLLPWREKEKKEKQIRFLLIVASFAGLGLFFTGIFHMYYSSKIHYQQQRNTILQVALDQESTNLMALNKQKDELIKVGEQLHFIYALRASSYRAVKLLNVLPIASPDDVMLYKIIRTKNTILVFGKAKSNLQITQFMESIAKSKFFNQPVLTEISGKEGAAGEDRNFQIKLEQLE
jgi:type IV pilus assembly protein PilN